MAQWIKYQIWGSLHDKQCHIYMLVHSIKQDGI